MKTLHSFARIKRKLPEIAAWFASCKSTQTNRNFAANRLAGAVVFATSEAYEQGRPVLASDLGGLKDMITDGQTGRLIEPGNQPAWVAALEPFIAQPEMSRQMGERGRQWLNENVSPAAWNRQFDEIIRKALREFRVTKYYRCR